MTFDFPPHSTSTGNTQSTTSSSEHRGGGRYQNYGNDHFCFFLSSSDPRIYELDWVKIPSGDKVRQRVIPRTRESILINFGAETSSAEFLLQWYEHLVGTSKPSTQSNLARQAHELAGMLQGMTIAGFRGSQVKAIEKEKPTLRSAYSPSTVKDRKMRPIHRYSKLGTGSSSTVWNAVDLSSGELFAVKEFRGSGNTEKDEKIKHGLRNEVDMLKKLEECDNITRLIHFQDFRAAGKFQMFFSIYSASLTTLIQTQGHVCGRPSQDTPNWWPDLVKQVSAAIEYIHKLGIIHRHIKPSNIFFAQPSGSTKEYHFLLGDFGLAITKEVAKNGVHHD
ncbi:kinase-like domain-containing protein [Podospora fimiseda]|uniref:non-specific serine/threonine protein kinase n=1 Tax=Podospora fimiseda TaxID=252190 RepID=A0AAN7BFF8_9PEZI|nr:kinase-like domain-containing protein [Podospora fimiseda]